MQKQDAPMPWHISDRSASPETIVHKRRHSFICLAHLQGISLCIRESPRSQCYDAHKGLMLNQTHLDKPNEQAARFEYNTAFLSSCARASEYFWWAAAYSCLQNSALPSSFKRSTSADILDGQE